jgi:hypothetical protein
MAMLNNQMVISSNYLILLTIHWLWVSMAMIVIILPIDEVIFFKMVIAPPTSNYLILFLWHQETDMFSYRLGLLRSLAHETTSRARGVGISGRGGAPNSGRIQRFGAFGTGESWWISWKLGDFWRFSEFWSVKFGEILGNMGILWGKMIQWDITSHIIGP